MTDIVKCIFQIRSCMDRERPDRVKSTRPVQQDCGIAAGWYRVERQLAAIEMPLCDEHRDFCINSL